MLVEKLGDGGTRWNGKEDRAVQVHGREKTVFSNAVIQPSLYTLHSSSESFIPTLESFAIIDTV
jgi:hypothetical protein